MAFLDTHRFDRLTEEEVVRRIGDLLAIAIGRFEEQQRLRAIAAAASPAPSTTLASNQFDPLQLVRDELERQVIAHLRKVGSASPRELAAVLGLNRRTISRKLARLCSAGLCQGEGRTRMTCYRLRTEFADN
ncbi:MAG: helix-turn-helix domain-containing protein [bacterium]|nr:helix-turn-helix domain-containing protein [bacterium]MDI1335874.1 helix-turn-helix domain-containing protein [Lacunisphaera sp.]